MLGVCFCGQFYFVDEIQHEYRRVMLFVSLCWKIFRKMKSEKCERRTCMFFFSRTGDSGLSA